MDPRTGLLATFLENAYRRPRGPGGDGHSLLANIETVESPAWDRRPPGGERTIRDIVLHVGSCKYMYEDYAFGTGALRWDAPPAWPDNAAAMEIAELMAWLDEGHQRLAASLRSLSGEDLDTQRLTNWGELWPARRIFETMIEHDLYHAGEINHIRGLLAGDDRWAYAPD